MIKTQYKEAYSLYRSLMTVDLRHYEKEMELWSKFTDYPECIRKAVYESWNVQFLSPINKTGWQFLADYKQFSAVKLLVTRYGSNGSKNEGEVLLRLRRNRFREANRIGWKYERTLP